jgi:hypothetical protein
MVPGHILRGRKKKGEKEAEIQVQDAVCKTAPSIEKSS